MKTNLLPVLFSLTLVFSGCGSTQNTSASASEATMDADVASQETAPVQVTATAGNRQGSTNTAFVSDADFVAKAAEMGMANVKLSMLAEKRAVNPAVKDFAVEMQEEHTRANSLLINMAREKKWKTPEDMNPEHTDAYNDLLRLMSDEFDQRYMNQMVQDHEKAVALFQQAATNVTDPELKTYVNNTLPALKRHLGMARDLQKK